MADDRFGRAAGVLQHVNVLDMSWVAAGPLCGVLFAYFGANVIKFESAVRVDVARGSPPLADRRTGINRSGYFGALNLGKQGVAVSLDTPGGVEIAHRLVDWADVVIEGWTPGTLKRWSLDYESLRQRKPGIIMISMTLQGQTGPHAQLRGYGFQVQGMSGVADLTGWPDRAPTGVTLAYPDYVTPFAAMFATVAALDYRDRTGKGQHIDVSQMEAIINLTGPAVLDYVANGREARRAGNRLMAGDGPIAAPHGVYPVEGEDKWIAITVFTDEEWASLCRVLNRDEWLSDPRFATRLERCRHDAELDVALADVTRGWDGRELMDALQRAGVAAGVVHDQQGLYADPQLVHRGHFVPRIHPEWGEFPAELFGVRLSKLPPVVQRPAPCLGQDNERVLREVLGYSQEEIDRLIGEGALEYYGGD